MNAKFDSDWNTAIHEAAHSVAADVIGRIPNYPEITPGGVSQLMKQTMPGYGGVCWLEDPVKPFESAVISWAVHLVRRCFPPRRTGRRHSSHQ
jgi:hypothetical protein